MGNHPLNLLLRFLLELAALAGLGWGGFASPHPVLRWVLGLGLPTLAAVLWGVFAVPDDPSRSGKTVVKTPGAIRLALELLVLGGGAAALGFAGRPWWACGLAGFVALHYLLSLDRVRWLLAR